MVKGHATDKARILIAGAGIGGIVQFRRWSFHTTRNGRALRLAV
jgi:hypothetical protein